MQRNIRAYIYYCISINQLCCLDVYFLCVSMNYYRGLTFSETTRPENSLRSTSSSCWVKFHNILARVMTLNLVKPGTKKEFGGWDDYSLYH
jgi:hypothetical protein